MIKLIAIDLDGTLYTSKRTVTSRVHASLSQAQQSGIQTVIVTGRGIRGAEIALDILDMDIPYICSAGAMIKSGSNGQIIHSQTFHSHHELLHIIECVRNTDAGLIAESLNLPPYWFGPDSMAEIMDPFTATEACTSIRSWQPEVDFDKPLLKVTITGNPDQLSLAETILMNNCPSIHYVYSGIQYIDLTADGVNKGSALSVFAGFYNINPEEIAAIGDQKIDLLMLNYAGLPIAMANAVPEVLNASKWIAPSNDEDGVAWAIEKILEQNKKELS